VGVWRTLCYYLIIATAGKTRFSVAGGPPSRDRLHDQEQFAARTTTPECITNTIEEDHPMGEPVRHFRGSQRDLRAPWRPDSRR